MSSLEAEESFLVTEIDSSKSSFYLLDSHSGNKFSMVAQVGAGSESVACKSARLDRPSN